MWKLLPIDLVHYILNFVDPDDFINVCRSIGRLKGKMSQQEQAKSKKYLWKRVKSDLEQNLLMTFPGFDRYSPLSVYRKYLYVSFDIPIPTNKSYVRLASMDCKLEVSFYTHKQDDELYAHFIEFSFMTKMKKISGHWSIGHEFSMKLREVSNFDVVESCTMKCGPNLYHLKDVLKPVSRFATFGMFKDEIVAIINKFKIHI